MKLCFVVDARSTIALKWIKYFMRSGHDVTVISSHACRPEALEGARLYQFPIAFGRIERTLEGPPKSLQKLPRFQIINGLRYLDRATSGSLRSWLTPLDLLPHVMRFRRLCDSIAPDLVHAMRIPYEGIMAALAVRHAPLLISCWGNDFTLFTATLSDRILTRRAMRRAEALHCDCRKDVKLALSWGFSGLRPSIVLPGAGGVDLSLFRPGKPQPNRIGLDMPEGARVIINPRGMRMYVRNDVFFKAIPAVLREFSATIFLCPGMKGDAFAEKAVRNLGIERNVILLPTVTPENLAEMFRLAEISVSPSVHDGTPNTLLEAMASGCFPIAGDIESVREWIENGRNGLLCDPASPAVLAAAIVSAMRESTLRTQAALENRRIVAERAEYATVMARAEQFYNEIIARFGGIKERYVGA